MANRWKSTAEVLEAIQDTHERLRNGTTAVAEAQAETRALTSAVKTLQVMLEHARLTGRLKQDDDNLPDMSIARKNKS